MLNLPKKAYLKHSNIVFIITILLKVINFDVIMSAIN